MNQNYIFTSNTHSSLNLYDRKLNSKLVKIVFPFDSPFTIIPLVVIAAILVFYALVLIKLKPSKEYVETIENDSIELKKTEKPTTPTEISANEITRNTSEEAMEKVQEETAEVNQPEAHVPKDDVEETEKKNDKDKELKKSFFLFGEREFEGCPHKFGYLKSLRKNAPIPDECFGCPQILECLMTRKSK
jgi:Ca2+/Na+ antiporter